MFLLIPFNPVGDNKSSNQVCRGKVCDECGRKAGGLPCEDVCTQGEVAVHEQGSSIRGEVSSTHAVEACSTQGGSSSSQARGNSRGVMFVGYTRQQRRWGQRRGRVLPIDDVHKQYKRQQQGVTVAHPPCTR